MVVVMVVMGYGVVEVVVCLVVWGSILETCSDQGLGDLDGEDHGVDEEILAMEFHAQSVKLSCDSSHGK